MLNQSGVILNPILNSNGNPVQLPGGGFEFAGRSVPIVLAQWGVPCFLPCDGTVSAAGVLTLVTALPATVRNNVNTYCWTYLPAGAIVGGLAGWYFGEITGTTTLQIYTNYVNVTGEYTPNIPAGPYVAAIGSGVAYVTPVSTLITFAQTTVPGGIIGPNGQLICYQRTGFNNSATSKTIRLIFANGGTSLMSLANTTTVADNRVAVASAVGDETGVLSPTFASFTTSGSANPQRISLDFRADQPILSQLQVGAATDWVLNVGVAITVLPGAR